MLVALFSQVCGNHSAWWLILSCCSVQQQGTCWKVRATWSESGLGRWSGSMTSWSGEGGTGGRSSHLGIGFHTFAILFRAPYANTASSNETANGYFLERSHSARLTLEKACELMPEEEVDQTLHMRKEQLYLSKLNLIFQVQLTLFVSGWCWWGASSWWGGGGWWREGGGEEGETGVRNPTCSWKKDYLLQKIPQIKCVGLKALVCQGKRRHRTSVARQPRQGEDAAQVRLLMTSPLRIWFFTWDDATWLIMKSFNDALPIPPWWNMRWLCNVASFDVMLRRDALTDP